MGSVPRDRSCDDASLLGKAIRGRYPDAEPNVLRVLDFGCGAGTLVRHLRIQDFDAFGCDFAQTSETTQFSEWMDPTRCAQKDDFQCRLKVIAPDPYRLPFPDEWFDVVVSTSVLEHVQNKPEVFKELKRVLRKGGVGLHLFPSKYYLPVEPHLNVPLASWFWPNVPMYWWSFWALLGVRNRFQSGQSWRDVSQRNSEYSRRGLNYLSMAAYREIVTDIFGNFENLEDFYLRNAGGMAALIGRALPIPSVASILGRHRMRFIAHTRTT